METREFKANVAKILSCFPSEINYFTIIKLRITLLQCREIKRLGPIFEAFMRAIRPIGSSSRLIRASVDLQRRMNDVLDLFRSNSAEIWKEFSGGIGSDQPPNELQGSLGPDAPSALKLLPCTMYHLSDGLDKFLESLCDIPEFMDQRLTDSLREFRDWIIYRAGRVLTHRG